MDLDIFKTRSVKPLFMRPRVHVNVAMSADGKLSTTERRQVKISGPLDYARVDRLKAACDAVMVGIGTVIADDPSLTVKSPELKAQRKERGLPEHPVRIVVDSQLRTPPKSSLLHKEDGLRIIACSESADPGRRKSLEAYASIITTGVHEVDLGLLLSSLYERGVRQLLVEGGGTLIWGLFSSGLVDELTCFIGNMIIGGETAPTLADGLGFIDESKFTSLSLIRVERIDHGVLLGWKVEKEI
jgi:2,5-diamino-6-(ribosylamino)-4(3H)-pyrimidinone 5'-phosphate reductase